MSYIARIAEQFAADAILRTSLNVTGQNKTSNNLAVAAGVFGLAGMGFVVFSTHLWLATIYEPYIATAMTGGVLLGAGLVIAAFAFGIQQYRKSSIKKIQKEVLTMFHEILDTADDFLSDPVNSNPKSSALIAAISGFLTGQNLPFNVTQQRR
jgi:hypothetical protein